jgi:hypothetical protein
MAGHERPDCRNDIEEKDQQESGRVVALSGHKLLIAILISEGFAPAPTRASAAAAVFERNNFMIAAEGQRERHLTNGRSQKASSVPQRICACGRHASSRRSMRRTI